MAGILVAFVVGPMLKLSGLTRLVIAGASAANLTKAILAARPRVSKTLDTNAALQSLLPRLPSMYKRLRLLCQMIVRNFMVQQWADHCCAGVHADMHK